MNKRLIMSAVFGAAFIGAGAVALSTIRDGHEAAPIRLQVAYAATDTSGWRDPFVFVFENGGDANDAGLTSYQPGATLFPAVPATGEAPSDELPVEDPKGDGEPAQPVAGDTDEPEPADNANGEEAPIDVPPPSDPSGKPPVIFNPTVTDAICEALHCDEPQLPYNPEITDAICQALDCNDDGDGTIDPKVDPCDLIGCPTPKLPAKPGKIIDVLRRL